MAQHPTAQGTQAAYFIPQPMPWPIMGSVGLFLMALFALVGVILTSGWLLTRGVDDAKWRERTAAA